MMRAISRTVVGMTVVTMLAFTLAAGPADPPQGRPARSSTRSSSPQPDYPFPYRTPRIDTIIHQLLLVKNQIVASTFSTPTTESSTGQSERAAGKRFALVSYPMGVIFNGMLSAADATGDQSFAQFDIDRFQLFSDDIAKLTPTKLNSPRRTGVAKMMNPTQLDDCGAIGIALVKAKRAGIGPDMQVAIDHIAQYIGHKQLRLEDGTLARPRPFHNSLWADDAYMGIPYLAEMGALTNDRVWYDDAAQQILHFAQYLYHPETGLFTHHWNTGNPDEQPTYYWGRANGWCTVAMVEVLDVLPEDHPLRGQILRLFRQHCRALASLQSGDGLWHQMLDRVDTGTETSCSAMFAYCMARGVNKGWLDSGAFGPVAQAAWNGLAARIDDQGHITGTCVGTGYADDYVYYYHRPLVDDIHGYGPVLLAGSEMIRMLKNPKLRIFGQQSGNPMIYYDRSSTTESYEPPPGQ